MLAGVVAEAALAKAFIPLHETICLCSWFGSNVFPHCLHISFNIINWCFKCNANLTRIEYNPWPKLEISNHFIWKQGGGKREFLSSLMLSNNSTSGNSRKCTSSNACTYIYIECHVTWKYEKTKDRRLTLLSAQIPENINYVKKLTNNWGHF